MIYMSSEEESYEYGLPEYLQHDLNEYKRALKEGSNLMDCLWSELYGSINVAEFTDGVITSEHANYLRRKYLFGDMQEPIEEQEIFQQN